MFGSNERAWSVVLADTCGFGNGPPNSPHQEIKGRGKTSIFMVKNQMVSFYSYFELFIEKLFSKWVFFL